MRRNHFSWTGFRRDRRGATGTTFAILAIPTIAMMGAGIDFGRAYNTRSELQQAIDAAVLAGARKYRETGNASQAQERILANFAAFGRVNFPRVTAVDGTEVVPTIDFVDVNGQNSTLKLEVSVLVATPFMSVVGINNVEVHAETSVRLTGRKLEMALMFDVTGSMDEYTSGRQKIADAKDAAKDLLDIVMPSSGAFSTRLSLIPFSQRIKLDAETMAAITGQPAIKSIPHTTTQTTTTYTISTSSFDWLSWSNCVKRLRDSYYKKIGQDTSTAQASAEAYCQTLETRINKKKTEYKTPDIDQSTQSQEHTTYTYEYIKPCVVERITSNSDRRTSDEVPTTGEYTAAYSTTPTANHNCPPNGTAGKGTIIPLTTNRERLIEAIDNLQTGGYTAGGLGTAWSWYTIAGKWRSVWTGDNIPSEDTDESVMKAAVLMTDGEYNSCNGSSGGCNTQARNDAIAICQKMRDAGIQVWTIGFGMSTNPNDTARQTLVQCAGEGRYFFPYNGDELRAAFQNIGSQLVAGATGARVDR